VKVTTALFLRVDRVAGIGSLSGKRVNAKVARRFACRVIQTTHCYHQREKSKILIYA
jgi:hypothetical protein